MKNKILNIISNILISILGIFSFFIYFYNLNFTYRFSHFHYFGYKSINILFFLLLFLILILITFLLTKIINKKKLLFIIYIIPITIIIFFSSILFKLYIHNNSFENIHIIFFNYMKYILLGILIIAFILYIFYKLGGSFLKHIKKEKYFDILSKIGIGFFILSNIFFILTLLNLYNIIIISLIFLLIISIYIKDIFKKLKVLSKIKLHINIWDTNNIILFFICLILCFNILSIIRPIPIGFDDSNLYLALPKLQSYTYNYISGFGSYPIGLINGYFYMLFPNSAYIPMFFHIIGGILIIFGLSYLFTNCLNFKKTLSNFLILLFIASPSILFQFSSDIKIDLWGIFFNILFLINIIKYIKNKNDINLYLSALFLSQAFTIKYNNIITILAFIILLSIKIKSINFKKYILTLFFLLLAFLPWGLKNISTNFENFNINTILFGYNNAPNIKMENIDIITGKSEELSRYTIEKENIFFKTYNLITNDTIPQKSYVDMGFWWLLFLILSFIFLLFCKKDNQYKHIFYFFIFTIIYWIIWVLLASWVIWYGWFGCILCLILGGYMLENKQINLYSKILIYIILCTWLFFTINLRISTFYEFDIPKIQLYNFTKSDLDYLSIYREDYKYIINKINKNNYNIYKVGTFIKYYTINFHTRILEDNQLDVFSNISYQTKDEILDILKLNNFKYIIIDRYTPNIDQTKDKSLINKYNNFIQFINYHIKEKNIKIHIEKKDIIFGEIVFK